MAHSDCLQRLVDISQTVLTTSFNPRISATLHLSDKPSAPSTVYSFPLPPSLNSDFLALGCNTVVSQQLSQSYTDAALFVEANYETEFYRADRACNQLLLLVHGSPFSHFQDRMRSLYVSRYMTLMYSWAGEAVSMTRHRLMEVALSGACLKLSFPTDFSTDSVGHYDIKRSLEAKGDQPIVKPLTSKLLDLKPLLQREDQTTEVDGDILHQNLSVSAFPKPYPCPNPAKDSCLKVLSPRPRQIVHQFSHDANVDTLIGTTQHLFTMKCSESDSTNDNTITPSSTSITTPLSLPPPSSTLLSLSVVDLVAFNLSAAPYTRDPSDTKLVASPTSLQSKARCRKLAALPKRIQVSTSPSVDHRVNIVSPTFSKAPTSAVVETPTSSLPSITAKQSHCPPLAVAIPSASPPVRIRKMAALPRHTMKSSMSTIVSPASPHITSYALLSVANVSSLSRTSPPSARSRSSISRTPSLVSLTSSDSGSSSPSSDGLDTPPSTPPPFVNKVPPSISPSSLSSKSFTPTFDSAVSPSNIFQSSSTKQPKIFEAHLPSGAVPYSSSTGIKREEVSFSFVFGR
uniref:B2 mating type protein n=1 Tax=Heterobasidion occidentale TaxID=942053 RepID=S5RET0_9AGAM|nr:b2 mating type protein [Heterobasidion occidentale]